MTVELKRTPENPIACTIDAGEMPARIADVEAFGRGAFLSGETGSDAATLLFAHSEENERRLTEIVAAESTCCAFLTFSQSREDGTLVLRINAPEGGEAMLRTLAAALSGDSVAVPS